MQFTILETTAGGLQGRAPQMGGRGICVIMPATDLGQAVNAAHRMLHLGGVEFQMVIANDAVRQGFVRTLNQTAAVVNAEFVAYVAQDALAGKNWLQAAHRRITSEGKGLCAFNDGIFNGGLAQFGLVRSAFAAAHYGAGNIFFPEYQSHRADEDISHLAHVLGQYTYAPDALLLEIDYRMRRTVNPADVELWGRRKPQIYALKQSA